MKIIMDENHHYTVDGKQVLSTTQILQKMFPQKYAGVSEEVLQRAADRGTRIHGMIEQYALHHEMNDRFDLEIEGIGYPKLEDLHYISIESSEKKLAYMDNGEPLYAGTYDMLGTKDNRPELIDIKCTSVCDRTYLSWQLSMYAMALEQETGKKIETLACIWVPKDKVTEYIPIERLPEDQVLKEVREIVKA